ncbi:MAG: hypothetical protein DPW18_06990 [Chloroflexi bacterium]|nr:hypothetical protein [Chloroflexota bacterium]MDL1941546.1 hypothetical protein [Chloroflexi bacterium CFX2]
MTDNLGMLFDFFIGVWRGIGEGVPGRSQVERTYEFVLDNRFVFARNKSVYAPQEKNPGGEIHEDWSLVSYDGARTTCIMRQFHVEGFVNQYVLDERSADGRTIRFVTESIENIPPGWRARETYQIVNADEFIEIFELAEPGKEFEKYSENRFHRVRASTEGTGA